MVLAKRNPLKLKHNKAFKRDSCRVAFLVCGDFCGESGVRKLGLGGIHPLTRRYVYTLKSVACIFSLLTWLSSFGLVGK
ncbi:hypothetical protein [Vibrio vulnificus YJ016]|uniref:DUF3265 domain-containing protein n=1 Tax=Vibrio vulnificus (strain YJ016) TaxID=196600 RepID=Q7MKA6_VIBVY|nr:hypothetical protein [Vibrio vulnificus YJ016]